MKIVYSAKWKHADYQTLNDTRCKIEDSGKILKIKDSSLINQVNDQHATAAEQYEKNLEAEGIFGIFPQKP